MDPVPSGLSAIAFAMGSAVCHAIGSAFFKQSRDKAVTRAITLLIIALGAIPVACVMPLPSGQTWLWLGAAICVSFLYQQMMIRSFTGGDLSMVYPFIRGLAPPVVVLGSGWVLGERLTPSQLGGIGLICLSLMALAAEPLVRRRQAPPHLPALAAAICGGICAGTYTLIDTAGVRSTAEVGTYISWFFILLGTVMITALTLRRGIAASITAARQDWRAISGAVVFIAVSYALVLLALRVGTAGVVSALRETSVVFGALLGVWIFREGFGIWRLGAAVGVAAGAVLVSMASMGVQ